MRQLGLWTVALLAGCSGDSHIAVAPTNVIARAQRAHAP